LQTIMSKNGYTFYSELNSPGFGGALLKLKNDFVILNFT